MCCFAKTKNVLWYAGGFIMVSWEYVCEWLHAWWRGCLRVVSSRLTLQRLWVIHQTSRCRASFYFADVISHGDHSSKARQTSGHRTVFLLWRIVHTLVNLHSTHSCTKCVLRSSFSFFFKERSLSWTMYRKCHTLTDFIHHSRNNLLRTTRQWQTMLGLLTLKCIASSFCHLTIHLC